MAVAHPDLAHAADASALAALSRTEDRLIAALAKLGSDALEANAKFQKVLTGQTQAVKKALEAGLCRRDLRGAGPQVLGLIAAVHGASSRCTVNEGLVTRQVQGLLDDIRALRRSIQAATPVGITAGTAVAMADLPQPQPLQPPAATADTARPQDPLPHPEASPWAVASLKDIDEILYNRHPRYDVYRVEEDRLSLLKSPAESPGRWSLVLAVRSILQEHRRQIAFYGGGKATGSGSDADGCLVAAVPRLTVLTALRRIGAEPSDVEEHAIAIDELVEAQLADDDFLCAMAVDAPLLKAYPQWCLFRPMCHYVLDFLESLLPGLKGHCGKILGTPAFQEPPEAPALAAARATIACAVLYVLRSARVAGGAAVLRQSNVALTPAEWIGLQAGFERWVLEQEWGATDQTRLALAQTLQLRLYPSCLRQLLVDRCWARVRQSTTAQWSLAFWERVGVTTVSGYRRPSGRCPVSACGPLASTGCPFVGRPTTIAGVARPVACLAKIPTIDPRFDAAYLRSHRSATDDDLDADPAFNAAGEGSEIDEEELVAGCELPREAGGFGPLPNEEVARLSTAGERLAERLARVAHVDLPTGRYDPASRFFFAREVPRRGKKRPRSRSLQGETDTDESAAEALP